MFVEGICISQGCPDTANSFCYLSICVCVYMFINKYIYSAYIKKFIIRGGLTWLWRVRHPETYSQKVKNPGEPTCSYSLRTKAWEQEFKVWVQAWKPVHSTKPKNSWIFSWIQSQEKTDVSALQSGISLYLRKNWPLCLVQAFSWLNRATLGETNAQPNDLNVTNTPRITFDQMSKHSDPVKLTHKIKHHKM